MIAEMETRRVQIYRWHPYNDDREKLFCVDAALEYIRQSGKAPNAQISLECAQEGLSRNAEAWKLEKRYIARADLNQPVIFITVWNEDNHREEHIMIDGWHRFRKMVAMGRTEPLSAYVFSLEDSKLLEIEI